jgi:hypothetical protein
MLTERVMKAKRGVKSKVRARNDMAIEKRKKKEKKAHNNS